MAKESVPTVVPVKETLKNLEDFRVKMRARAPGFYGDRKHYEVGSKDNPERAGHYFYVRMDCLKYDEEARIHVDSTGRPLIPTWMEPLHDLPVLDKSIPQIVKEQKNKLVERKRPAGLESVGPIAWPKNVQRRDPLTQETVMRRNQPHRQDEDEEKDED